MATINLTAEAPGNTTVHPSRASNVKVPYLVEVELDWAELATEKGSALAAADVIEAIYVPAGTMIINAGLQVITAAGGESADNALDLGVTGVEPDVFVDGFDLDAAAAGAYAQNAAAFQPVVIGDTADTIDVLIQAATTAPTSGSIRVFALLVDVKDAKAPGLVALGS